MIFETHAHLDDARFDEDREEVLASLPEKGIKRVINVGNNILSMLSFIISILNISLKNLCNSLFISLL